MSSINFQLFRLFENNIKITASTKVMELSTGFGVFEPCGCDALPVVMTYAANLDE